MKKLIALALLLCTFALLLSSCGGNKDVKIEKPEDTNLEYWLLDSPNKKEWTKLGSNIYLAATYKPIFDEDGKATAPEDAVIYYIDNYPISEIGFKKIDGVAITDPSIYVWGLTINSTKEDAIEVLSKLGFSIESNDKSCSGKMGQYRIKLTYGKRLEIHYWKFSLINTFIFGEKAYN